MPRMHTKECLAESLIAAIQNFRDYEGYSDADFRTLVEENKILEEADGYLNDGLMPCKCPPLNA